MSDDKQTLHEQLTGTERRLMRRLTLLQWQVALILVIELLQL